MIEESTRFTHEVVATYSSCLEFARNRWGDIDKAIAELAPEYRGYLRQAEEAFGELRDERTIGSHLAVAGALVACAQAALNLNFDNALLDLERIAQLVSFVRDNSPDERLRTILRDVRPNWEHEGVLGGLIVPGCEAEVEQYIRAVHERLRNRISNLDFVTDRERPAFPTDILREFRNNCARSEYSCLNASWFLQFPARIQDDPLGSQFTHPKLDPSAPLDLSLVDFQYTEGRLEELVAVAKRFEDGTGRIFAHVSPFTSGDPSVGDFCLKARMHCIAIQRNDSMAGDLMNPLRVECTMHALVNEMSALRTGCVVFKMDERSGDGLASMLAETRQPVFVLLHDTSPRHVVDAIKAISRNTRVVLSGCALDHTRFSAAVVAPEGSVVALVCPTTAWGFRVIAGMCSSLENVRLPLSEDDIPAISPPMGSIEFQVLVFSAFVGVSGDQAWIVKEEGNRFSIKKLSVTIDRL